MRRESSLYTLAHAAPTFPQRVTLCTEVHTIEYDWMERCGNSGNMAAVVCEASIKMPIKAGIVSSASFS